jgi:hypothetical protein
MLIAATGVLAAAAVGYVLTADLPKSGQTAGTVLPADRYQSSQVKSADVVLGDTAVAELMQTDAYEAIIKDKSFRALASDPSFVTLAQNPEALAAMARQPKLFANFAQDRRSVAALAAYPQALQALARNPDALRALAQVKGVASGRWSQASENASAAQVYKVGAAADSLKGQFLRINMSPQAIDALSRHPQTLALMAQHPNAFAAIAKRPAMLDAIAHNPAAFAVIASKPGFAALVRDPSFAVAVRGMAASAPQVKWNG